MNSVQSADDPGRGRTTHLVLAVPEDFNFARTILSHGWCVLPPFSCNRGRHELAVTLRLPSGIMAHCRLSSIERGVGVEATSTSALASADRREIAGTLRSCLRLDEDLRPFHADAARYPHFRWIARARAGRMLRSPTVFEDAVKILCTTNCSWPLTTAMVSNLVTTFGPREDGLAAFPRPASIASASERDLRKHVRSGYRSPFLLELSRRVASGSLDVEAWRSTTLPTEDLRREIASIKGFGPYAVANLLKLVGRYEDLGLDSWLRTRYAELHARGRKVSDATIERAYRPFGRWRGLFLWLEMTRDWHAGEFPLQDDTGRDTAAD